MKKVYKRALMAFAAVTALSTLPASADDLTVNEGTDQNQYVPLYGYNMDSNGKNQNIYDANQLTAMQGGTITSIGFSYASVSRNSTPNNLVKIYMGQVDDDMFTSMDFIDTEGLSLVFEGTTQFAQNNQPGVFTIDLTNPYVYNGGNLVVAIDYGKVTGAWATVYWYGLDSESTTQSPSLYKGTGQPIYGRFYPMTTFTYNAPVVNGVKDVIDGNLNGDYTVVDLSGKTVARGNGNVQDAQRGLNPGMYIVRIGGKASKVIVR